MIITFSLTCPLGLAIGIEISNSYNAESVKAIAIQGTFNGVSAGMLLYVALVQLIAEDALARNGGNNGGSYHSHGSSSPSTSAQHASVAKPRRVTSLHHTDCHAAMDHYVRDDDCQCQSLQAHQSRSDPGFTVQMGSEVSHDKGHDRAQHAHHGSAHDGEVCVARAPAEGPQHGHHEPMWLQPLIHTSLFLGAAFMALLGIWA